MNSEKPDDRQTGPIGLAVLAFSVLRIGLRKPMFRTSLKELEKDKEWLSQSKIKLS